MVPDLDDPLICLCRRVRESEILTAVGQGCRTLAEVRDRSEAATGCGECAADIEDILAATYEEAVDRP
ncbi:(2Fe-2S)-binding protein [Streptomyces sp. NPDC059597]|uniref:(2Fe-2S)-binding protein n=1 Tax=Streptomyces sp. NPDC059597 TaxID=3346879 RepID=UPI00368D7154